MNETEVQPSTKKPLVQLMRLIVRVRDWFSSSLGVGQGRKEELYLELSKATTLKDFVFWLQIFFAAGIATLGLVLNSPAVIIGAMLISPLMGPILASGLALATGDLILGIRAVVNLLLSCLGAIVFAVLLVAVLPFKEMTGEIAARTSPTTLDLFIAFFSGAIGSVAICREVKGVVTSIPGVAIAVALMPPLCVVGYGVGVALSLNFSQGMQVATGGGLLFVTNLVAITFTAMIVFLLLRIDTRRVREKVDNWRDQDPESQWWRGMFTKIPALEHARKIRSFPLRMIMILLPLAVILVPLTQSFVRLRTEITRQQQLNRIEQTAVKLWQQYFAQAPNGEIRSYLDEISVKETEGKTEIFMRVFDNTSYTASERNEYIRLLASHLNRPPNTIALQMIEIPTSARTTKQTQERVVPPSIAQLQSNYLQAVQSAMRGLVLPPPARQLDYEIVNPANKPVEVRLWYFSDRDIGADAQVLLVEEVKARLSLPAATLRLERIPAEVVSLFFEREATQWRTNGLDPLATVGRQLERYPDLRVEVVSRTQNGEGEEIWGARRKAISEHFRQNWQVASDRIVFVEDQNALATTLKTFIPAE